MSETLPLLGRPPGAVLARRGGLALTGAAYLAEVEALAARLDAHPPGPVLNLCEDRVLALLALGAALSRGRVTLLSADRSAHRLRALVALRPGALALHDGRPPEGPFPALAVPEPGAAGEGGPNPLLPAERPAAVGFTSGSTGEPTAHAKPWGALVAAARAAAGRFGMEEEENPSDLVATVPPQHMYGFETTLLWPLHAAAAAVSGAHFYPVEVADSLAACPGRRVLVTTPLQLRALAAAGPLPAPPDLAVSATAPLDPALAAAAEALWGAPVHEIYGATECGSIASRRTAGGSAWRPYRGVTLDAGAGLVCVPGLPAPVPLADELAPDGPGGAFRLLGRRADLVKRGGKRASLAGLDRLLAGIEGVRDGAFFAPDDLEANPSARLAAYVVAPGLSAEAIVSALRERVEAVFLPRPVVLLDALPRDPIGKLPRRALAALHARATVRSPGPPPPEDGA